MLVLVENLGQLPDATTMDSLSLTFEQRSKARLKVMTDNGQDAGLFLERGKVLRDGDVLRGECGSLVVVRSRPEEACTSRCDDWLLFAKVCFHLGNRHAHLQIGDRWLRFKPDSVLEEMVRHLGLECVKEVAPFEPESGAYSSGHSH
ncbi:MAG: urease accessory protein UreE [Desulfocurvibacter africanus]